MHAAAARALARATTTALVAGALATGALAPLAHARPVLGPEAGNALQAALAPETPLPGGAVLKAKVEEDKVALTAMAAETTLLAITLAHPDAAPQAPRAGGFAVVLEPGPAPDDLVAAITARLAAAPPVRWDEIDPPVPARPADEPPARGQDVQTTLELVRHLIDRGDKDEARRALDALAKIEDRRVLPDLAAAYKRLGDDAALKAVLDRWEAAAPQEQAVRKVFTDPDLPAAARVEGATAETACEWTTVAYLLASFGQHAPAFEVAAALRKLDPECARAWTAELSGLLQLDRLDEAWTLAQQAVAKFPEEPSVHLYAASIATRRGAHKEATGLLEALARRDMALIGTPGRLLGPYLRDPEAGLEMAMEYKRKFEADPKDALSRYLYGVHLHYTNDFEESNTLLTALEDTFPRDHRLQIYIAMNDFNLGKVDAAIARLDRAANEPPVDPDVFYCRAEILRDRDRPLALADLKRAVSITGRSAEANPKKEARVEGLIHSLERCLETGQAVCDGDWEHPRKRGRIGGAGADPEQQGRVLVMVIAGGVLFAAAFFVLRRKRA